MGPLARHVLAWEVVALAAVSFPPAQGTRRLASCRHRGVMLGLPSVTSREVREQWGAGIGGTTRSRRASGLVSDDARVREGCYGRMECDAAGVTRVIARTERPVGREVAGRKRVGVAVGGGKVKVRGCEVACDARRRKATG